MSSVRGPRRSSQLSLYEPWSSIQCTVVQSPITKLDHRWCVYLQMHASGGQDSQAEAGSDGEGGGRTARGRKRRRSLENRRFGGCSAEVHGAREAIEQEGKGQGNTVLQWNH